MNEMLNPAGPDGDQFMSEFMRNQRRIYYSIVSLIQSATDVEDVYQAVCMTLWRCRDDFDPDKGSFGAWAVQIARNEIRNFHRKHRRQRTRVLVSSELVDKLIEVEAENAEFIDEQAEALRQCLNRLDNEHRELIEKFYERNISIEELANTFKIARRTLYRRIDHIREALFKCVKRWVEGAALE